MTTLAAITIYHNTVAPAEQEYKRIRQLAISGDSIATLHLGDAQDELNKVLAEAEKTYFENIGE